MGYILPPPPPGFDTWEAFGEQIGMPAEDHDSISAVVDPDGAGPRLLFLGPRRQRVLHRLTVTVSKAWFSGGDRRRGGRGRGGG
ncbi:MAG: hypothetical protein ACRD0O_17090, partial [Acidimicrobiia bacterium]